MASIFRKDDRFFDKPNRNNFDLSFQNNVTFNAGPLIPVFCKEVLPGDSFQIKPTFGIRAMPLVFPIQTRMKAYLHFYYVRNRNLWKDWMDFIGGTKPNLVPPYLYLNEQNRDIVDTGKIGDYLGIPTVTYGEFGSERTDYFRSQFYDIESGSYAVYPSAPVNLLGWLGDLDNFYEGSLWDNGGYVGIPANGKATNARPQFILPKTPNLNDAKFKFYYGHNITGLGDVQSEVQIIPVTADGVAKYGGWAGNLTFKEGTRSSLDIENIRMAEASYLIVRFSLLPFSPDSSSYEDINANIVRSINFSMLLSVDVQAGLENKDVSLQDLPFISDDNVNGLRLSALPFRAYESIYNCFYRNAENNPLIGEDGQPEYNKWILNNDGGADTTHYQLRRRNWEDDFLTTALPSPQQGNAPLVGLTGTATINFASEDGTEQVTATTDENGQITAINAGNSNLSDALSQMVDYGISINDFRNVNALQRWLENNIRRGFKYQDQIQTHYGVSVRYDELDMPEFIGGATEPVMINQISQTVSSDTQILGDYAGQASCVGSGREITHYCDEHGYIIGILCVSPVAVYSQLLPKHFLKGDKFDYFFPEFGHIGPQPIPLKEVTPLQTFRQSKEDASVSLDDTFGYQRAWYEYLASTDEVHGLFRNQLRNFLINRTFDETPELGAEFTTIDPSQVNDVFAVQDTEHKLLGQVYFDVSAKRPIPLYGIPKLE